MKKIKYNRSSQSKKDKKIRTTVYVKSLYLQGIEHYGDISKTVNESLHLTCKHRFTIQLRELLAEIAKNIELLQLWKDNGPLFNEGEIDEYHLKMLETYRNIYFTIKESKLLYTRRKREEWKITLNQF